MAKKTKIKSKPAAITLNISLARIRPKIWRRVVVPADLTLANLHDVFQVAMGWEDCHLHHFEIGDQYYATPNEDWDDTGDESAVFLFNVLRLNLNFDYVYDFGDNWCHKISVENVVAAPTDPHDIRCLGGRKACPPEDCGGPYAYPGVIQAIRNPEAADPEFLEMMEGFDPDHFAIDKVNNKLQMLSKAFAKKK